MCSFEKFNETKLPWKDNFYSSLTGKGINDKNVNIQIKTGGLLEWQNYKIKRNQNLYLRHAFLFIFWNFRKKGMKQYGLDTVHYLSSPRLNWDAIFKMTGVKPDTISDSNMYQFFESKTKGSISNISKRYKKSKNKSIFIFIEPLYDKNKRYLIYEDDNNLYSKAMEEFSQIGKFKMI